MQEAVQGTSQTGPPHNLSNPDSANNGYDHSNFLLHMDDGRDRRVSEQMSNPSSSTLLPNAALMRNFDPRSSTLINYFLQEKEFLDGYHNYATYLMSKPFPLDMMNSNNFDLQKIQQYLESLTITYQQFIGELQKSFMMSNEPFPSIQRQVSVLNHPRIPLDVHPKSTVLPHAMNLQLPPFTQYLYTSNSEISPITSQGVPPLTLSPPSDPIPKIEKRSRKPKTKANDLSDGPTAANTKEASPKKKSKVKVQKSDPGKSCQNCGAAETPEWRSGPSGPKTLCNRCGLRYAKIKKLINANKPTDQNNLSINEQNSLNDMSSNKGLNIDSADSDKSLKKEDSGGEE